MRILPKDVDITIPPTPEFQKEKQTILSDIDKFSLGNKSHAVKTTFLLTQTQGAKGVRTSSST